MDVLKPFAPLGIDIDIHDDDTQTPVPLHTHRHVLVVEDDPCLKPVWEHMLHKIDPHAHVLWTDSIHEADLHLTNHRKAGLRPALVIADIYLVEKEVTGLDLWRKHKDDTDLRFVLVSSFPLYHFLKIVADDPVHPAYLQKPLDTTECIPLVQGLLHYDHTATGHTHGHAHGHSHGGAHTHEHGHDHTWHEEHQTITTRRHRGF